MKLLVIFLVICTTYNVIESNTLGNVDKTYAPNWKDLDTRPLPEWYDRAKIGIFMHWGVYSVPSFGSEWFWSNWKLSGDKKTVEFMNKNYPPGFTYQEFAPMFTAEFFDPDAWASLFQKSGAKYIVLTSKHHEGFTLFPSRRSFSWNAMEVGPKRDLLGELAQAVRKKDLKFGVYHSLYEWFNPIYLEDKRNLFLTKNYVMDKLWPDLKQIVYDYEPSVIWSDGDWEAFDGYWNSTDLLAWLYNESPVKDEIVVNDRWGIGIPCHHGDFYNCADRYNPDLMKKYSTPNCEDCGVLDDVQHQFVECAQNKQAREKYLGKLQNHKWENAFTIDSKSWGYRRNMQLHEILTIEQLLKEVVSTVSCGGNALINIGPTKEGTIAPIFQERLLSLGRWLSVNGEAIYETSPWLHQNDTYNTNVWYTCTKQAYNATHPTSPPAASDVISAVFAVFLHWPRDNLLKMRDIVPYLHSGTYTVQLLGNDGFLNWKINSGLAAVSLPDKAKVVSRHAWTLKLTHKQPNTNWRKNALR